MERFTARRTNSTGAKPAAKAAQATQETFGEMANATANRSGVVGKLLVISLIIVSIAITAFVGYAVVGGINEGNSVDGDKYQAVFLSDGQIYFGKLSGLNKEYVVLEDIFYLQVEQEVQPDRTTSEAQTQISLAKLGNELHGPEDMMHINPEQILFWENLKDDGQVVSAITAYEESGDENAAAPATTQQTAPATTQQAAPTTTVQ